MSFVNPGQPDKTRLAVEKQELVRSKIEELEESLKYQKDPSLRKYLESDIELMKSMIDNGPLKTPETVDALYRDPKKYTDPVTVEASRTSVKTDDMEQSLRMLLNV